MVSPLPILLLFCLVGWSTSKRCPAQYLRFTPQHTFCLPKSRSCQIYRKGVFPQDEELILKLHNQFRSKTAMGNEDRARDGTLPPAADMIQMEWDYELAAVAQKWTENCYWGHDCRECRAVENFAVGQNLHISNLRCPGGGCAEPDDKPDWTSAITGLYGEVKDYYSDWLDSFVEHPGPATGHFTQVVWSRSWKVGCGYSFYKQGDTYHKYYACNYGPTGNMNKDPVYIQGPPCSACPTNTKCSTSKTGPNTYPGLCKLANPNTAPTYSKDQEGPLFYCVADPSEPDCQVQVSGDGTWKIMGSVGGNYYSVVLKGGQSTRISFVTPIKPNGAFCIQMLFRKGPLDSSKGDSSSFKSEIIPENGSSPPNEINPQTTNFKNVGMNIPWESKTKIGFTFSVPRGAGKHVLDIRKIAAHDGPC